MKQEGDNSVFSSRRVRGGFSLIEVLLVAGIGIILAALTLVSLSGQRGANELNDTARRVATTLREAANRSMNQNGGATWGVHFENQTKPFFAMYSNAYASNTTALYSALPPSVSYAIPSANASSEITFNQITGTPTDPAFSVVVYLTSNVNNSSTIAVLPTGAISYGLLDCAFAGTKCTQTVVTIAPGAGSCNPGQIFDQTSGECVGGSQQLNHVR